jgi:NAD(P)-dependent dehydrogenase (short-subunit alcohol dehydrogenase family)
MDEVAGRPDDGRVSKATARNLQWRGAGFLRGRTADEWVAALSSARVPLPANGGRQVRPPVALVTGGGRGLGRVVAGALAAADVAVGLVARTASELATTVAEIASSGGIATSVTADVRDEAATMAAVETLERELGPVELLVNNAGIGGPIGPTWEVDPWAWWYAVEINLGGTLTCTRLVLPQMLARRRGRIVNITSRAGVFRWPTVSAYSVSKAAVIKLTENLAAETRPFGVSVFGVHPGLLPIGLSEHHSGDGQARNPYQRRVDAWVRNELEHGHGTDPARAGELIVRLASGAYDTLSGRQLSVDDDLDAIVGRIEDVRDRELYHLRLRTLADAAGASQFGNL